MSALADKPKTAGLAGLVAGQTAICTVGKEELGLTYRGYTIEDLAREASFEEVAYLLIHGTLPTQRQLDEYQRRLMGGRDLPDALREILTGFPPLPIRWTCSAPAVRRWAAWSQSRVILSRKRSPTGFWRRSRRCCWTGITSAISAGGSN